MVFKKFFLVKLIFLSFLCVFILRSLFFLSYPEINTNFVLYYWLMVISIVTGVIFGITFFSQGSTISKSDVFIYSQNTATIVKCLSLIWLITFFMYLIQKGSGFWGKTLTEIRYEKIEQGGAPSFFGVILDSFCFFCAIQFLLQIIQPASYKQRILSTLILVSCFIYNLLSGGRIGVLLLVLYLFLFLAIIGYLKKISARNKLIILSLVIMMLSYFIYIFMQREAYRGRDIHQAIDNFTNTFLLSGTLGTESTASFVLLSIWGYLTHSVNEFYYLFTSNTEHWLGAYSFYKIYYLFSVLGIGDFNLEQFVDMDRRGVYLGLLGGTYLDFGHLSFVYLFFVGFLSSFFHIRFIQTHDFQYLFILLTCVILFITAPVFSILNSANGLSMIICSMFYYLMSAYFKMESRYLNQVGSIN